MINIPKNTDITPILVTLVTLYSPHTYVELGTKNGFTFNKIVPLVGRAIAVDRNGFKGIPDAKNVEKYHMLTDDFAKTWKDPVDFLFIDACHEKNQVLKDFDNFSKFVVEGTGIICLHDTYPIREELRAPGYCHNAWQAAWEIRRNWKYNDFEIVTLPGPYFGISIARKISIDKHFGDEEDEIGEELAKNILAGNPHFSG